jgi:hypothetical protein
MAVLIGIIETFWSITLAIIRTEILPKDLVVTKLLTSDIIILSSPSAQHRSDPCQHLFHRHVIRPLLNRSALSS